MQEAEQRNSSLVIEVDEQAYLHEKTLQDEFQVGPIYLLFHSLFTEHEKNVVE